MSRVSGVGRWCKRRFCDPFSAESARCWVKGPGWTTSLHRIPQLISRKSIQIRSQSSCDSAHQKRSGRTNFIRHRLFFLLSPLIIGTNQCSRSRHDARHEIVEETDIVVSCSLLSMWISPSREIPIRLAAVENSIMNQSLMLSEYYAIA